MENSMTYKKLAFLIAILLLPTLSAVAQIIDMPLATVDLNGTEVLTQRAIGQSIATLERTLGRELTAEEKTQVLESEINALLVNQAAAQAGITVREEEVDAAIEQQRLQVGATLTQQRFQQEIMNQTGLTWPQYRAQVREQLIQSRYVLQAKGEQIQNVPVPTEAEIRRVYEENATQFSNPAMVRFDHLFFDTRNLDAAAAREARALADSLYRQIQNGSTTFERLMRDSLDDTRYAGGDFGYLLRGDAARRQLVGDRFFDTVFGLDEDEVAGVLESNLGFHIVKITDRRAARLLSLDDPVLPGNTRTVRRHIQEFLTAQRQQAAQAEAVQELVDELRDRAEITIYENNLPW